MVSSSLKNLLPFFVGVFLVFSLPPTVLAVKITDVRFWSATDHTRIVLDLTDPIQYESFAYEKPPQLHLELKGASILTPKRELRINDSYLLKMTLTDLGRGKVKIIFYQKRPLNATIFPLKPYLDKPHRLVIDLVDPAQEKKEEEERQKQKEIKPKGSKIVVIDPGHGGEDPGALGPQKTMEKDVVLKVGKKLVHLLNQNKEIHAFLTRKDDYFIGLEKRAYMAGEEYKADLFVSIHADGSFNPQARGSSVYCLSLSGATDKAAKILADKENLSNLLGGASSKPNSITKNPKVDQILLDLMQNNSMRESFRYAELILNEMRNVNHLKYPTYRQANFIVLRSPNVPSILVELAFITNREDEYLLKQNEFQEKIAKTLTSSIQKYFR